MKVEREKSGIYIKGAAEIYHSVTYMPYGYMRFFGFSLDDSYYELEEKQDENGKTTTKLTEVTEEDFNALLSRFRQMTKRWKGKQHLKTLREEEREQVVEFSHNCKKQLCLHKRDANLFTDNQFKSWIDEI